MTSGSGSVLTLPDRIEFEYALPFKFGATKNEAEYEAIIVELILAKEFGAKAVAVRSDSRLVVE
jgi:ribonuclease HI